MKHGFVKVAAASPVIRVADCAYNAGQIAETIREADRLGVKVLVRKKGEFKRHCASRDPYTGESNGCVCGKRMDARCKSKEKYQPLDVNENLMEEMR